MSAPIALSQPAGPAFGDRLAAHAAVVIARPLAALPAGWIRRLLGVLRRGTSPATASRALAARRSVVTVSTRCAGQSCLQRSLATVLLCRMRGVWPVWCVGVRTQPFRAHAWVQIDGIPVGEPFPAGYYHILITV